MVGNLRSNLDGRESTFPPRHAPPGVPVIGQYTSDPRAGHGPGIGGFKADSEIGVAMAAGHPVYFVGFTPEPEPDQTIGLEILITESFQVVGYRA